MKSSQILHHFPISLALTLSMSAAIASYAQSGGKETGKDTISSTTNTVTHIEPPASHYLSQGEMRAVKPMPMATVNGPPVPQQTTPVPYPGPVGNSPPGVGGPVPR
jgi:hypothetical protein